jgi:hypothetical protein
MESLKNPVFMLAGAGLLGIALLAWYFNKQHVQLLNQFDEIKKGFVTVVERCNAQEKNALSNEGARQLNSTIDALKSKVESLEKIVLRDEKKINAIIKALAKKDIEVTLKKKKKKRYESSDSENESSGEDGEDFTDIVKNVRKKNQNA